MNLEKIKELIGSKRFSYHSCSMCGYPCGYFFKDDKLYYDNGCDCVSYRKVEEREHSDIFTFFNMNPKLDIEQYVKDHLIDNMGIT